MKDEILERLGIGELVQQFMVWIDQGDWENFRSLWHADGVMVTSSSGKILIDAFIPRGRAIFDQGRFGNHLLGGTAVEIRGDRAIAQAKATMSVRHPLDGVLCDIVAVGRFYQLYEKRSGRWGVIYHTPIYEKCRLDPVDPDERVVLDRALLNQYPESYRYMAYGQIKALGATVSMSLPELRGPVVEALYAKSKAWLGGQPLDL